MATEQARETANGAESGAVHGGRLVAQAMKSRGASKLFTLSGGHLFSIYDGCKQEGIDVVDFRHEQSAAFAAIGWAKATREPGICALTAGCGVTNGMSAIASAQADGVPLVALGGRAPEMRWGSGSLQEIDHLPFVGPLVKSAITVKDPAKIARTTAEAIDTAAEPPLGPTFVDYPLDVVFSEAESEVPDPPPVPERVPDGVEEAAKLLAGAERPAIMAGTNLYWGRAETELRELAEALGIPVFLNGLGRGCLPPDHELYFARARGSALQGCDVALVIGVPLDFRLGFGGSFGEESKLIQLDFAPSRLEKTRQPDLALSGDIGAALSAIRESVDADPHRTSAWVNRLRVIESEKRGGGAGDARRRPLPAPPDARLQGARRLPRSRRDRGRRRRRLRQLRRAGLGDLGARDLDGSRAPTAASAPAPARRSAPSSPTPSARSACCSATAPSASPGWSSTRWPATTCRSSR